MGTFLLPANLPPRTPPAPPPPPAPASYHKTGTGKTYTMGILGNVTNQHDGIVPRALGHIFGHMGHTATNTHWAATLSFLQIYLESIQGML
jgi:hypothetical protein